MKTKTIYRLLGFASLILTLGYIFGFLTEAVSSVALASVACAALEDDLEGPNCDYPIAGGVEDLLYLINKDDIASYTTDVTNPLIVEDITLVSGAFAYRVQGQNNSNNTRWEVAKQRFTRSYNHFVSFIGFDLSPDGYQRYQKIVQGKFVAVVVNNYRGPSGNGAIKIYGLGVGLEVITGGEDKSSPDTQGAVQFELGTGEVNKEPNVPATLWDTDFATSLAIIEGLAQ